MQHVTKRKITVFLSSTGDPNLAAIAQEASGGAAPAQPIPGPDDIPKGLAVWREALNRSSTSAQLAMCLYSLESSIAWDKSIMKAVSVFNKQTARKYNSKLSVGACVASLFYLSFSFLPIVYTVLVWFRFVLFGTVFDFLAFLLDGATDNS